MRWIDAKSAKIEFCKNCLEKEKCEERETVCSDYANFAATLDSMPTIDADPITTVWMRGRNKDGQDGIYCCECGYFVPLFYDYYYDVNDLKNDYMYCPHCGRKTELRSKNDNEGA